MYEPSRLLSAFYIAGFQFWDGACALDELRPGMTLSLVPEPDNPHDPEAVAIYFGQTKLGFVPADENGLIALMLHYGHGAILEPRVQQVDPKAAPWQQVRIGIYITDAR